jgi:hypothetical protein
MRRPAPKIAADLTKELLILNTGTMRGSGDTLVVSRESKSNVMSGVWAQPARRFSGASRLVWLSSRALDLSHP